MVGVGTSLNRRLAAAGLILVGALGFASASNSQLAAGTVSEASSRAGGLPAPPPLDFVPSRRGSGGAPCGGAVRCVGPSGAYSTITAAANDANDGDTIQVEQGTYTETVEIAGKQLTLLGGFSAGFASRDPVANPTVIDGEQKGTTLALTDAGDSTIDGFTITGGSAKLDSDRNARGSGIRVTDSGAVTIANNLITGNDDGQNFNSCNCSTIGGGIEVASYLPGASVTVASNIIRDNRAHRGGAMAIFVPGVIRDNLVENNHGGGDHGGGLYLSASKITVRHNLIRGNEVGDQAGYGWGGGAIFFGPGDPKPKGVFISNRWVGNSAPLGSALFIDEDAAAKISGDLFHDNACDTGAAALYVDGTGIPPTGSVAKLFNVTMTDHRCGSGIRGSAIFTEGGSSIAVANSIITGNGGSSQIFVCRNCQDIPKPPQSTIEFSLVGGRTINLRRGKGMLSGSPKFVSRAADDFHLAAGSKAIDAANPKTPVGSEPRPNGGRRNIGAYGGSVEATESG